MIKFAKTLFLILFIFLALKIPKNYHRLTGGFRLSSCEPFLEDLVGFSQKPLSEELAPLFDQRFFFLKRGSQAYVFLSEDRKYVLKLFAKPLKQYLFQPYTHPKKLHLNSSYLLPRMNQALNGYSLAEKLPQEATGIVYLHLNPTKNELPSVTLQDAFGRIYRISLDSYRFAVQRTCTLLAPTLEKLARQNNFSEIERLRKSYDQKISLRVSYGIRNTDTEFKKNFGILDGEIVEFDVGEYCMDPSLLSLEGQKEETALFQSRFDSWLKKRL